MFEATLFFSYSHIYREREESEQKSKQADATELRVPEAPNKEPGKLNPSLKHLDNQRKFDLERQLLNGKSPKFNQKNTKLKID